MRCAWRSSAVVAALVSAVMVLVLPLAGSASAEQRSARQLTATQLAPLPLTHGSTRTVTTQTSYVVRQGDTLSKIAKKMYGHANRWPALWYTNRHKVHNPNAIRVGQKLTLDAWHPKKSWILTKAIRHIPVQRVHHYKVHSSIVGDSRPSAPSAPVVAASYSGPGGFQSCVIQRESGGNATAQNPTSTASGLYGFLDTTWTSVTGLPGPARAYSVATQNAAFAKAYAEDGTAPWGPYDGC